MSNEIVHYGNELNTVPFRKFSPNEMNLFFSIVSRMKDQQTKEVQFSFDQLKSLSKYKPTATKRFIDDLDSTYHKMLTLTYGQRSEKMREYFVLFTGFKIDSDNLVVSVRVNPDMTHVLNDIAHWTRFSLEKFNDLSSGYAKTMFRLLKQFRTQGWAEFSKEDLYELLDIPKSYKQNDLNKRVLKPIKEELTPLFRGLSVRKKHGTGRGKPVIGYRFTWKQENNNEDDFSKGQEADQRKKLYNIQHNSSLSQTEKWRAMDRVLGLPLGTSERDATVMNRATAKTKAAQSEWQQQTLNALDHLFQ